MPAVQTTYSETMRVALAGHIADTTPQTILSRTVESATGLGFGVVCVKGTGDRQVKPAVAGAPYIGISVAAPTIQHLAPPLGTPDFYPDKDTCNVIVIGAIWVQVSAPVVAGDPAFFVPAGGALTNVATANTPIPGGRFETSAAANALAKLRLT